MSWKYNGKPIIEGQSWVSDDEITHPKNWASVWSTEDKENAGLVWEDDPEPHDTRFYDGRNEDGSLILKNFVTVQTTALNELKQLANEKLSPTDWYITRFAEKQIAVPSNVVTYRDAVRAKYEEVKTDIQACLTTDDLATLFSTPNNNPLRPAIVITGVTWPTLEE